MTEEEQLRLNRAEIMRLRQVVRDRESTIDNLLEVLEQLADKAESAMGDHVPAIVFARDAIKEARS